MNQEFFNTDIISKALEKLKSDLNLMLTDHDVLFEREIADFSVECSTLSDQNISNVEVMIDALINMCSFFSQNVSKITDDVLGELRKDMFIATEKVSDISMAVTSLSVVRVKLASGMFQKFQSACNEVKFLSSSLFSIASGTLASLNLLTLTDLSLDTGVKTA